MATLKTRDAVRLGWGLALLATPDRLARLLTGPPVDRSVRQFARVLGARQVLQALLLIVHDRAWLRRAGRGVDLLHAFSMVLLSVLAPGRARLALTDALLARLFAGGSSATSGRRSSHDVITEGAGERPGNEGGSGAEEAKVVEVMPSSAGAWHRRRRRACLQQAIHEAFQVAGGQPPARVRATLETSIARRGLAMPAPSWLEAVTSDLARGVVYVVSGPAMQDSGLWVERGSPL